jgi:hypothetical protein
MTWAAESGMLWNVVEDDEPHRVGLCAVLLLRTRTLRES